mmetsp:Transcript_24920/g.22072  ORF Transcript_24920/g.22072 Transcript_24920/m.22072 type:complete len:117 (-) Transcript_24920:293-643(-)
MELSLGEQEAPANDAVDGNLNKKSEKTMTVIKKKTLALAKANAVYAITSLGHRNSKELLFKRESIDTPIGDNQEAALNLDMDTSQEEVKDSPAPDTCSIMAKTSVAKQGSTRFDYK